MNIKEFKKGDIITRVEPFELSGGSFDRSYMGNKFRFVSVDEKSNRIYVIENEYRGLKLHFFELDLMSEGWNYYPFKSEREAKKELIIR